MLCWKCIVQHSISHLLGWLAVRQLWQLPPGAVVNRPETMCTLLLSSGKYMTCPSSFDAVAIWCTFRMIRLQRSCMHWLPISPLTFVSGMLRYQ